MQHLDKKAQLLELFKKHKVIQTGRVFHLTAGGSSNFYIDVKTGICLPKDSFLIAELMSEIIPLEITCLASTGYGGIAVATSVRDYCNWILCRNLNLSLVRPEKKPYGTQKQIEGHMPNSSDLCAIIDDVFTTGSSINLLEDRIQQTGAKISGAYVVVNRTSSKKCGRNLKIPLHYIFHKKELL